MGRVLEARGLREAGRPSTHAFEAARRLLDGDPMPWDLIGRSGAGLAVVLPVSLWTLWRMLGVFRARGYVTRYS